MSNDPQSVSPSLHHLSILCLLATVDDRLAIYTDQIDRHRSASLARRLPLSFLTGDPTISCAAELILNSIRGVTCLTGEKFQSFLDAYMRRMLMKGAAPLFKLLKCLYSDPEKVNARIVRQ